LMVFYGVLPGSGLWSAPLFLLLTVMTALAAGLWLSALNIKYRDVRYAIPFIIQFWFFVSPVAYPASLVPDSWRWLYALNPMVGVIDGFRWALLGQTQGPGLGIAMSIAVMTVSLAGGLYYFRRVEKTFADEV